MYLKHLKDTNQWCLKTDKIKEIGIRKHTIQFVYARSCCFLNYYFLLSFFLSEVKMRLVRAGCSIVCTGKLISLCQQLNMHFYICTDMQIQCIMYLLNVLMWIHVSSLWFIFPKWRVARSLLTIQSTQSRYLCTSMQCWDSLSSQYGGLNFSTSRGIL